jgi:hypothetical protein
MTSVSLMTGGWARWGGGACCDMGKGRQENCKSSCWCLTCSHCLLRVTWLAAVLLQEHHKVCGPPTQGVTTMRHNADEAAQQQQQQRFSSCGAEQRLTPRVCQLGVVGRVG